MSLKDKIKRKWVIPGIVAGGLGVGATFFIGDTPPPEAVAHCENLGFEVQQVSKKTWACVDRNDARHYISGSEPVTRRVR